MMFSLIEEPQRRSLLSLVLLAASLGCSGLAMGLDYLIYESRNEKVSTAMPFEKAPCVDPGRVAQPGLLAKREGTQEVRIVRDRGLPAWSLLISIDGAPVAEFWEGEALALWLPPGRHVLKCQRRTRTDKALPFQSAAELDAGSSSLLELEVAPESRPCVRLAIIGSRPKPFRLDLPP